MKYAIFFILLKTNYFYSKMIGHLIIRPHDVNLGKLVGKINKKIFV